MAVSWYAYVVECSDGTFYTGCATDVRRRVKEHNEGKGSKYVRSRLPAKLMLVAGPLCNRSEAQKMERRIKNLSRADKDKLVRLAGYKKSIKEEP